MTELTLYVPGLFGPHAAFSSDYVPTVEYLSLILARARHEAIAPLSYHGRVNALFGYSALPDRDIPVAAVSRLAEAGGRADGAWMRADPVHLRADRNGLVLIDASMLGISENDAADLAEQVRASLESAGARLELASPERWYLRLHEEPDIITEELDAVIGRDIGVALPAGGSAARWNRLLNEMQMLLHDCEVNRAREARGLPPVNSLWFWGSGVLPLPGPARWDRVFANDAFSRGLASLCQTPVEDVPADLDNVIREENPDHVLVILDHCRRAVRYRDLDSWHAALGNLESGWFGPSCALIKRGKLKRFSLLADRHAWAMSRSGLYRFWRRRRSLAQFITGAQP